MSTTTVEKACVGCAMALLVLAIAFGIQSLFAWFTIWVLSGFGVTAPFWPTMGALFLFGLLTGGLVKGSK